MQHSSKLKAEIATSSEWGSPRIYAESIHIGWYVEKKDGRQLHTFNMEQKCPLEAALRHLLRTLQIGSLCNDQLLYIFNCGMNETAFPLMNLDSA